MGSIVTVENLGKKYTIGHQKQGGYQTLRDTLSHGVKGMYQRIRHPLSPNTENIDTEEFWALKDVSFDAQQGDRLGIIGRNGAGKSTLLKILSRITHPTAGKIHIKGRVASLLEVGTGFHPELTGRENIFLNGAILGMTKNDIRLRYDEIVAFADIEKFLDTPVKRYSSGMYVRLAFAVAAHLEPEILIIDEVLAVGDAQFQKKCLGKMDEVSQDGRTILFVSHNMNAVKRLCNKATLLEQGKILQYGNTQKVIDRYLDSEKSINRTGETIVSEDWEGERRHPGESKIVAMRILDKDENICTEFRIHDEIYFEADIEGFGKNGFTFSFSGRNALGVVVYHIRSQDSDIPLVFQTNSCKIRVKIPKIVLTEGTYSINGWLGNHLNQLEDYVSNSVHFTVSNHNHSVERLSSVIYETGEWGIFEK